MRKFLAIAIALGLLGLIAPMQVSAQTTVPPAKVTPPVAKVTPAPETKAKSTNRQVKRAKHGLRLAGIGMRTVIARGIMLATAISGA